MNIITELKTEKPHFSGFSSLVLGLRGWGGVSSILRKTSSGLGWAIFRLRGFFDIFRISINHEQKPIIITATQIREGSWVLWEYMGDDTSIEFIDDILQDVIYSILKGAVVFQPLLIAER